MARRGCRSVCSLPRPAPQAQGHGARETLGKELTLSPALHYPGCPVGCQVVWALVSLPRPALSDARRRLLLWGCKGSGTCGGHGLSANAGWLFLTRKDTGTGHGGADPGLILLREGGYGHCTGKLTRQR